MKVCIVVLLSLIAHFSFSQSIVSHQEILEEFKKSVREKDYKSWDEWSGYWETSNKDGLYYKSDTIVFVNKIGINRDFCKTICWRFLKKDEFVLNDIDACNEPPLQRILNQKDYFQVKIQKSTDGVYIELYNQSVLRERFLVLSLEVGKDERVLVLKRAAV